MMILGVTFIPFLVAMAGAAAAGFVSKKTISHFFDKEVGLITAKNKRQFEAELDKLVRLLQERESKKETGQRGVELERLVLGDLAATGGRNTATAEAPTDESVPPLGPTGGLELDEGALLADSLGVSQEQVRQASRPPTPPSIALFGRGPG